MNIPLKDIAKQLNVSVNTVLKIKKELGYKKGSFVDSSLIPEFREALKIRRMRKKNKNPMFEEYYKIAVRVLEEEGYIDRRRLLAIFHAKNMANIEGYFEGMENPLYNEASRDGKKVISIYKLLNPVFAKWKEEARTTGTYNNYYNGSGDMYHDMVVI